MPANDGFRDGRHRKQVFVRMRHPKLAAVRQAPGTVQAPIENPLHIGTVRLGLSAGLRRTKLRPRVFCSNLVFNRIFIAIRG
jgi:hypothetical protein